MIPQLADVWAGVVIDIWGGVWSVATSVETGGDMSGDSTVGDGIILLADVNRIVATAVIDLELVVGAADDMDVLDDLRVIDVVFHISIDVLTALPKRFCRVALRCLPTPLLDRDFFLQTWIPSCQV